jgi:leader peptidase (prepilin peptidase)/N-methyltransferase
MPTVALMTDLNTLPEPDHPAAARAAPAPEGEVCSLCGAGLDSGHPPWVCWCGDCARGAFRRWPRVLVPGAVLALSMPVLMGTTAAGFAACGLVLVLAGLALTDLNLRLLPDDLTLPLIWAGLLVNLCGVLAPLPEAVEGAVVGYLVLWSLYWGWRLATGLEGLGYGDFKLLAALGAWLGVFALPVVLAVGCSLQMAAIVTLRLRGRDTCEPLAFGPALAMGGIAALLVKILGG